MKISAEFKKALIPLVVAISPVSMPAQAQDTGFPVDTVSGCAMDAAFFVGFHAGLNAGVATYGVAAPFNLPQGFQDQAGYQCAYPVAVDCVVKGTEAEIGLFVTHAQRHTVPSSIVRQVAEGRVDHCLTQRQRDFSRFFPR